jgi:hypothetical protein
MAAGTAATRALKADLLEQGGRLVAAQATHDAILSDGIIYFIYSFDMGSPFDIHKAADRLLKSGIAETVVSPRDGQVRVAHRYQELARLLRQSDSLREISIALEERQFLRWMASHPFSAINILARSFFRRSRTDSEQSETPILDRISQNASTIERSVAEYQVVNAIQHHIEKDLLAPSYLAGEPYLRLRLRSAGQWLALLNGGRVRSPGGLDEGTSADILLLIHRSGVMQLTIALKLPDDITVAQYRSMCFGSSEVVCASRIAEPVLRAAYGRRDRAYLAGDWEEEEEQGVRWRLIQHEEPGSISDLFNLYLAAVSHAIKREPSEGWFCYPVTFIDKVGCCDSEASFRDAHPNELHDAIMRSVSASEVRSEALASVIPEDSSLTKHTSFYCNMASAIEVRWPTGRGGNFAGHLQRLVLLESALLQYWQIHLLDRRVGVTDGSLRQVREIQREAIFGLREYRDSSISYGTGRDLVERLLVEWRVAGLYGHVLETIDQLQQLVVAAESKISARRANLLAAIALIVAIFLGLPAIDETLDIAKTVKVDGALGIPLKPFLALSSRGEKGTWIGYLAFLSTVLACLLAVTVKRRRRSARIRRLQPGISWPLGTVRIVRREESQDS